ncbi:uncharacterized protein LOC129775834 isoform X2 [Toxorhynchites rutilus septentrionalis]|nr:uncharacterized protein LOC129775834 isoform X2 [Toxorhynchites rutilus septentrionalis]
MNRLSQLLKELKETDDKHISFQQANIFVLFVETFAFHNIERTLKNLLEEEFLNTDSNKDAFVDTRKLMLKKKGCITLRDIETIIRKCCSTEPECSMDQFFKNLKLIIDERLQNPMLKLQTILTKFPDNAAKGLIGKSETTMDSYDRLKNLVFAAYRKKENLDQSWFEFVANIYPALGLENKHAHDMNDMEKQLRHLRNNLVHQFYQFGIEEFRAAIIDIRGKLFEYYYAKKTNETLASVTVTTDVENLQRMLNENVDQLRNEFTDKLEDILTEEEARKMYGYKLSRSLFEKRSASVHENTIREQVVSYLKYVAIVEDMNSPAECEDNEDGTSTENVELFDSIKKREMFEGFTRLKKIHDNFARDVYVDEKSELFDRLAGYGVSRAKLYAVSELFIEEDTVLHKTLTQHVENVVRFMLTLEEIVTIENEYKQTDINTLFDLLLNQNNTDKKLIFKDARDDLESQATYINRIKRIFQQLKSLGKIDFQLKDIKLQIDLKRMTQNMLAVFYNAFHEYTVEFNIEDIFSRESFLNEIVWQNTMQKAAITDFQVFTVIQKMIKIDYLAPLIVKIIENRTKYDKEVVDKESSLMLMDVLLGKKKHINYLNILLSSIGEKLNLYQSLCDKLLKKELDLQDVRELFTELEHILKIDNMLTSANKYNQQPVEYTLTLTNNSLKIINEEAVKRIQRNFATEQSRNEALHEALQILQVGQRIQNWFDEADDYKECHSQIVYNNILIARIQNRLRNHQEALSILESEQLQCLCTHQETLLIQADIVHTRCKKLKLTPDGYDQLYNNVLRYVLALDDQICPLNIASNDSELHSQVESFDIALTVKEKYDQVKNTDIYENLLASSKLLHSKKYLDILRIAADAAQQLQFSNQHQKALNIYKNVYTCYKNDLGRANKFTIRLMLFIAKSYSSIGEQYKQDKKYTDALMYFLAALLRYNIVHDARERIYGYEYVAVCHIRLIIAKILGNIAFVYNNIGSIGNAKALTIYKILVNFQENIGGKEDAIDFTKINVMYTYNMLARQDEMEKKHEAVSDKCIEVIKIFGTIRETSTYYENARKQWRFAVDRMSRIRSI